MDKVLDWKKHGMLIQMSLEMAFCWRKFIAIIYCCQLCVVCNKFDSRVLSVVVIIANGPLFLSMWTGCSLFANRVWCSPLLVTDACVTWYRVYIFKLFLFLHHRMVLAGSNLQSSFIDGTAIAFLYDDEYNLTQEEVKDVLFNSNINR